MDREDFGTGTMVEEVATVLEDVKDEALRWTLQVLQERGDFRDDYRELVELVIIFLGGAPPSGIRFRAPGAMHHARWMSKVLLQDLDVPGPAPLDGAAWTPADVPLRRPSQRKALD